MRLIKFFKRKIRVFILYFYNKTTNYISDDLMERITIHKNDLKKLDEIADEVNSLRKLYPDEPELIKAETLVCRLLVMKG